MGIASGMTGWALSSWGIQVSLLGNVEDNKYKKLPKNRFRKKWTKNFLIQFNFKIYILFINSFLALIKFTPKNIKGWLSKHPLASQDNIYLILKRKLISFSKYFPFLQFTALKLSKLSIISIILPNPNFSQFFLLTRLLTNKTPGVPGRNSVVAGTIHFCPTEQTRIYSLIIFTEVKKSEKWTAESVDKYLKS